MSSVEIRISVSFKFEDTFMMNNTETEQNIQFDG